MSGDPKEGPGKFAVALVQMAMGTDPRENLEKGVDRVREAARRGAVILTISPLRANWVLRAYSDVLLPTLAEFEAFLAAGELKSLLKARGSKTVPDVNL